MNLKVIEEVYRKKTEKMELIRRKILQNTFKAVKELSNEVFFEDAYIFGSLTQPYQFGDFSDVDIAFKGLARDNLYMAISFLSRKIGREVNVVPIERMHFAKSIFKGGGIRWKRE